MLPAIKRVGLDAQLVCERSVAKMQLKSVVFELLTYGCRIRWYFLVGLPVWRIRRAADSDVALLRTQEA